ncbi:hypothetical protein D9M68_990880 [compost metagenome]
MSQLIRTLPLVKVVAVAPAPATAVATWLVPTVTAVAGTTVPSGCKDPMKSLEAAPINGLVV